MVATVAITAFLVSFFTTTLLARFGVAAIPSCADLTVGAQKIHAKPVPRIGGVAFLFALLTTFPLGALEQVDYSGTFIICASIIFLVGLSEDLTKNVRPLTRLSITSAAVLFLVLWSGIHVPRLGYELLDLMLEIPGGGVLFTVFAIVGIANATNIIDGLNGLAAGHFVIVCVALLYVALNGDSGALVGLYTVTIFGAIGFLVLNFPMGKIFLGDGGAYLIGFCLAWLCILSVNYDKGLSPWFIPCLLSHPITETIVSIFRRITTGNGALNADNAHLHSTLRQILSEYSVFTRSAPSWAINSGTTLILLIVNSIVAMTAVNYRESTQGLTILFFILVVSFLICYALFRHLVTKGKFKHEGSKS